MSCKHVHVLQCKREGLAKAPSDMKEEQCNVQGRLRVSKVSLFSVCELRNLDFLHNSLLQISVKRFHCFKFSIFNAPSATISVQWHVADVY